MKKLLFLTTALLLSLNVFSQSMAVRSLGKNRRNDIPTTIKADAMDIDIAGNKASFLGNVVVNDQDMSITCRRMNIFLYEEKQDAKAKNAPKDDDSLGGGRRLDRIECHENVVIIRKRKDRINTAETEQKATAGKAVYDCRKGTITLTVDPVISQGTASSLKGEVITLHLDSERISVVGGKITSSDVNGLQQSVK